MSVTRKEFMKWLHDAYGMNGISFSKGLCVYLAKVNNGSYASYRSKIPYDDLLDMWQRKWNYLEKQNAKEPKTGEQRIYYDLSIILSKYDSYLAWKMEQEAERIEKENRANEIEYSKALRQIEEDRRNNNEVHEHNGISKSGIDISELLDEIWIKHDDD